MGTLMTAEINKIDIENLKKTYSSELVRKAIRSALDKTATWSKNYLADEIAKTYKLPSKDVRRAMHLNRTTQTKLESQIITESTALELIKYFNAIQDPIGVSAIITPGWMKKIPHAFINRPRNSRKKVVMLRTGKKRYPTTGKGGYGPPIQALLGRSKILKPAIIKMQDHLYKELEDQITKRTMGQTRIVEIE